MSNVIGVVGGGMYDESMLVFSMTLVRRFTMLDFCVTMVDCWTIICWSRAVILSLLESEECDLDVHYHVL